MLSRQSDHSFPTKPTKETALAGYVKKETVKIRLIVLIVLIATICGLAIQTAARRPQFAGEYSIINLEVPGGNIVRIDGINNLGQLAGSHYHYDTSLLFAFIWENGSMTDLFPSLGYSWGRSINDSSQVGGSLRHVSGMPDIPYIWSNGETRELFTPDGEPGEVADLNNLGQAVGYTRLDGAQIACLWDGEDLIDLGTLGGAGGHALAINNHGQVVGFMRDAAGNGIPFLWENGAARAIGAIGEGWGCAFDINNNGQVVGRDAYGTAFLWENDVIIELEPFSGCESPSPTSINDSGVIVGNCEAVFPQKQAFIWMDGIMYGLNELLPPDSEWEHLESAWGINDAGWIVGEGLLQDGSTRKHAFLLIPSVPVGRMVISGPATGIVNMSHVFTATVSPVTTTLPITYSWQATGQLPVTRIGNLSNAITFTWRTTGTKNITVTATNAGGVVSSVHTITITSPSNYAQLEVAKQASPDPVQFGGQLTYTIHVTNTGNVTLTATITDTLPSHITTGATPGGTLFLPGGTIVWPGVFITPSEVWTESFAVTIEVGYEEPLLNVVQVTTEEGATGVYTETSTVTTPPGIPTLLAPPNGTITSTQAIAFAWQASTGGTLDGYNLQLDSNIITTTSIASSTILAEGIHTWTVRAFNAAGYSDWAAAWTVEIDTTQAGWNVFLPIVLKNSGG